MLVTHCKMYSELSPLFEKNIDRIKFVVSTAPMFSEILSVSPSHTSLMAMVSTQWNLLFPVLDGRSDGDHALSGNAPDGEVQGITCTSHLSWDNSEVWILCHFPEFPYRMKILLTHCGKWCNINFIGCIFFSVLHLHCQTHAPCSLLLPLKGLYMNPWLSVCFS